MQAKTVDGLIQATEKAGSSFASEVALVLHQIGEKRCNVGQALVIKAAWILPYEATKKTVQIYVTAIKTIISYPALRNRHAQASRSNSDMDMANCFFL